MNIHKNIKLYAEFALFRRTTNATPLSYVDLVDCERDDNDRILSQSKNQKPFNTAHTE